MKIDKDLLKNKQYKTAAGYCSRIGLLDFAVEKFNVWEWTAGHYDFAEASKILEVGCGTGDFWKYIDNKNNRNNITEIYLTDFSENMLKTTEETFRNSILLNHIKFEVADVEMLKYKDNNFDVVLAHLMLYHPSSQEKALSEIKRVLKPSGWVGITTLNIETLMEIFKLAHQVDPQFPDYAVTAAPFDEKVADNLLPNYFKNIQKFTANIAIQIADVGVLMKFIHTHPVAQKLNLTPEFFGQFEQVVKKQIAEKGYIQTQFRPVLYICRP